MATGGSSTLFVLVLAVLGLPPLSAFVGLTVRRERGFRYATAAATALLAAFLLTGAVGLPDPLPVPGILAVLGAVGAHLWRFRDDRVDLVVVGCVYAAPVGLAIALLVRAATPLL